MTYKSLTNKLTKTVFVGLKTFERKNISPAFKAHFNSRQKRFNLVDLHFNLVASFQFLVLIQQLNGNGGRDAWVDAQNLVVILIFLLRIRFNRTLDVAVLTSLRGNGKVSS